MKPLDVLVVLGIAVVTAGVLGFFLLDWLWEWFRPNVGEFRKGLLTVLLFGTLFLGIVSLLPQPEALIRERTDTPEARQAARPPDPPMPATPDVPLPDTSKERGVLPGEELTVKNLVSEQSIRGHVRAPQPFYVELTVPAGTNGQPPAQTFRGLPITVKDKDWKEPIQVFDAFESVMNNDWVELTATVRLPTGAELAGRTGTLTIQGKVSYPTTHVRQDASKKLFTKVETKAVDRSQDVLFITPADRAQLAAARADYNRRVEQSGAPAILNRWEKEKAKQAAAADFAFNAATASKVSRVYWTIRGLAALGFVFLVLLAWPARTRTTPYGRDQ